MANSIRTPKKGLSANSRRIAEAVDDEDWQRFRLSLKGKGTESKVHELHNYFTSVRHLHWVTGHVGEVDVTECDMCVRVDNYIKALCRGGQLHKGMSLSKMLECDWMPHIKS